MRRWMYRSLIVAGVYALLLIPLVLILPNRAAVPLLIPLVVLLGLAWLLSLLSHSLTGTLSEFLRRPSDYQVFDDHLPTYRFVDWLQALDRYADRAESSVRLEASEQTKLKDLLGALSLAGAGAPTQKKICTGYEQYDFFPEEVFWLVEGPKGLGGDERVILRLRWPQHYGCTIEIASTDAEKAQLILKHLEKDALDHSIFRGQFLEVRYRHSPHGDYEDFYSAEEMEIAFHPRPRVTEEDIILDERIEALLHRNVFDFFAHRDQLYQLGLPRKRALLFYGPPGTGKTHTCRYIHTKLETVTSILATGDSLTHLDDIGKLSRQLQPTLVIIEDVDLVFSSRELNPYGTALGELMDQLDGFTPDEEIIFLLTTNAIERVEEAIRDRPGRINQCVHLGAPVHDLRRRYLLRYLRPYAIDEVDMEHLVDQTESTTQAFLKEYVLRAVQVAAASVGYQTNGKAVLKTEYFDVAFEELTSHGDPHSHRIMGFQSGPSRSAVFGVNRQDD